MNIKEVEKKLNITRANIRFYEKEGLLEPKRNENEYRDYSENDLKRLEKILLFRKCNISIQDIRLMFSGIKNLDDVFKRQISIIDNEVKQLEGARIMCKKLAQEKSSIDNIDTSKYIRMMNSEEQKGNKFYNITEDYIMATEKLYQAIIENNKFKGGENTKKKVKIILYITNAVLLFATLTLFDYVFFKTIDWADLIILTTVFVTADIIGVRKYIESKNDNRYTKKQNITYFAIVILFMVIALFGYYSIKHIYTINKEPNSNILEMSVKKTLIDIANKEYQNNNNYIYAESHKILDYEVKNKKIYVYVAANYGVFKENNNELNSVDSKKNTLTMIYKESKNSAGIYELEECKENEIPEKLKSKANVNYEDDYFKEQINSYINN